MRQQFKTDLEAETLQNSIKKLVLQQKWIEHL